MVKNALLKNLRSKKVSAQIVIKIHRMIRKVNIKTEKNLEKKEKK